MSDAIPVPPHIDCFACGAPADRRMDIAWRWDPVRRQVCGQVRFGEHCQGPPGHVHGGAISTVLDEAMGGACWMSGHTVVAANLNVNFRHMIPLGTETTVEACVERVEGRKVFARGFMRLPNGKLAAEATSLMIVLPPKRFENRVPGTREGIETYRRWLREQATE